LFLKNANVVFFKLKFGLEILANKKQLEEVLLTKKTFINKVVLQE